MEKEEDEEGFLLDWSLRELCCCCLQMQHICDFIAYFVNFSRLVSEQCDFLISKTTLSTVGASKYIAEIYNLYLVQNIFVSLKKLSLPGTAEIKDVGDKRMAK